MARRREFGAHGWREVSREQPCQGCGHSHGCRESRDGNFLCWRVPSRWPRGAGWWHPSGEQSNDLPTLAAPVVARAEQLADAALLHRIYQDLLDLCPLSSAHRKHLLNEGWTVDEVAQFRAGSLPAQRDARRAIAQEMWVRFGVLLAQAPGFRVKEGEQSSWAEICAGGGMLLACSSWDGLITRLRVRPDQAKSNGPKYVWFSSSRHGGPGTGAPPAFYRPSDVEAPRRLLITEGEKKAHLAVSRLAQQGFAVIGVSLAGVGSYAELLPVLEQHRSEFEEIVIAFDQDEKEDTRARVALHAQHLAQELAERGLPVLHASWRGPKGLDDLLIARGTFSLKPYQPNAAQPRLVDAPELAKPRFVPTQLRLGEDPVQHKKMNVDQARKWMEKELFQRFRDEDLGDQVILLKGRPGVGKSHLLTNLTNQLARRRAFEGKRFVNMTPRHDFAGDGRQDWNIVTGLEYQTPGSSAVACHQVGVVRRARELGIARQEICDRCPLSKACAENFGRQAEAPYYLAMINSPEKRWQVNQNLLGAGREIWMNKLGLLTLDDVELWQVLVQERHLSWDVLRRALDWCERDLEYSPLQPLLAVLIEAGQSLDATDAGAELNERGLVEKLLQVCAARGMSFEEVLRQAASAKEPALFAEGADLTEARWGIPPRLKETLLRHLERELSWYRKNSVEGWNRTVYLHRDGLTLLEAQPLNSPQLRNVPIVVASASMTVDQVQDFFPGRRVTVIEPDLEMPSGVRVVQYLDKGFGKTSLLQSELDFMRAKRELERIQQRYPGQKVGCVTHKAAAERFRGYLSEIEFLNFYGQRGSNVLKDSRALVVMGTPCPNPEGLRRQAEAFYSEERKLQNYSVLRSHVVKVDGEQLEVPYRVMGDRRLSSWLDARREQELFQAVGRARLYDTVDGPLQGHFRDELFGEEEQKTGKKLACTVYAFTNVPIPGLEVDEYVSFIGRGLKQRKAVTQTRIASLVQAILKLRLRGEKLTQVGLARVSGLSVKMVRRLYLAALAEVERLGQVRPEVASLERPRPPVEPLVKVTVPLLESRMALPPPVSVSA